VDRGVNTLLCGDALADDCDAGGDGEVVEDDDDGEEEEEDK
jgi:hypothetical protein